MKRDSLFRLHKVKFMSTSYKPLTETYYTNPLATSWLAKDEEFINSKDVIQKFHQSFPGYETSKLLQLPNEHGVSLYVKEESSRFTLPSFKILGASWGVFRCLTERFNLNRCDMSLIDLKEYILNKSSDLTLVAATDGNHGRAVAYMAKLLGIQSKIFTPRNVLESECEKIRSEEGSEVVKLNGNYDQAVLFASKFVEKNPKRYVLIQDFAFSGYEDVPDWIAHGYATLCQEIPFEPDVIFIPAGAGCLAHGITLYYRSKLTKTKIFVVEPDTSYTVNKSLYLGELSSDPGDSSTIMDGLNCPTMSSIAFPILSGGVTFSGLVSDRDCVIALDELKTQHVNSGPCGAVTYAAFINFAKKMKLAGDLKEGDSVVVLSTEAYRDFRK
ncbi:similar to Debaryomyces hansenii DEHA2D01122g hypothetical protein [Maudiozyma saulgeensis]|uniref:Tryptophan synthase beta chain-like PALP domain-containing protein n=1 Tax=Maudiozyma saulgeensis TaxID=1789683 RepID=A0A1X7R4Z7_9SACH|nr:similar to Debaryomyces hansenii DEHA2D01122g hypothetical protein [Kazachstania saulgeensis]